MLPDLYPNDIVWCGNCLVGAGAIKFVSLHIDQL